MRANDLSAAGKMCAVYVRRRLGLTRTLAGLDAFLRVERTPRQQINPPCIEDSC
jgi:hypothetical protein